MRRAGISNPNHEPRVRPAVLDDPMWLSARYETAGMTITRIADDLDVSTATVRRALIRAGIAPRHSHPAPPGGLDPEWLREVYLTQQIPVADIAEQAGLSRSTIRRALSFHEILPRPVHVRDRPGDIDPVWLRGEYVRRHRSLTEIAGVLGIGATTVHTAVHMTSLGAQSAEVGGHSPMSNGSEPDISTKPQRLDILPTS